MLGPYKTVKEGHISYVGNKLFPALDNVAKTNFDNLLFAGRTSEMSENKMWEHISRINHRINISAHEFFDQTGALFTILPLTTRMISSPGAVYGKEAISYTTDTSPIVLDWFDLDSKVFLAESSQIYLELSLLQRDVSHVYSIYNSFRKEHADFSHLSEFHHIEYEGKVNQAENLRTALGLMATIIGDLLQKNEKDLGFFLSGEKMKELQQMCANLRQTPVLTFAEVLALLFKDTRDEKYRPFTQQHFGCWEEVRITEIVGGPVIISEYPLLEVPFYHAAIKGREVAVANNADFIWPGYREILGSGQRIGGIEELEEKAVIFDLPKDDYAPYLLSRKLKSYVNTSGFGLGWERMLQALLEMPFIWSAVHFPRGHLKLVP